MSIALAATTLAFLLPQQLGWFQLCVTVGFATHIVGDFLTIEGVNWVWPLKLKAPRVVSRFPPLSLMWKRNGYLSLPVLRRTGSLREKTFGALLGLYSIWGITASVIVGIASQ